MIKHFITKISVVFLVGLLCYLSASALNAIIKSYFSHPLLEGGLDHFFMWFFLFFLVPIVLSFLFYKDFILVKPVPFIVVATFISFAVVALLSVLSNLLLVKFLPYGFIATHGTELAYCVFFISFLFLARYRERLNAKHLKQLAISQSLTISILISIFIAQEKSCDTSIPCSLVWGSETHATFCYLILSAVVYLGLSYWEFFKHKKSIQI